MTDLSRRAERVLELARHTDDPDPGRAERIERLLSKRIALGAAIVGGGTAVSNSALGAGFATTAFKSTVALGVATTLAFTGWKVLDSGGLGVATAVPSSSAPAPGAAAAAPASRARSAVSTRSPSRVEVESASVAEPSPPSSSDAGAHTRGPRDAAKLSGVQTRAPRAAASAARAPVAEEVAGASHDLLAIEVRDLRLAQRALRAGESDRALALLAAQDARHVSGALAQERHAARVLALCQSGQVSLARREASSFESRFPESPLVAKIQGVCRDQ